METTKLYLFTIYRIWNKFLSKKKDTITYFSSILIYLREGGCQMKRNTKKLEKARRGSQVWPESKAKGRIHAVSFLPRSAEAPNAGLWFPLPFFRAAPDSVRKYNQAPSPMWPPPGPHAIHLTDPWNPWMYSTPFTHLTSHTLWSDKWMTSTRMTVRKYWNILLLFGERCSL